MKTATPSPATAPKHRERPILFSDPMVRAIIEGRKTQTRRTVKPQPIKSDRNPPLGGKPGNFYLVPDFFPTSDNPGHVIAHCEAPGMYHCMGAAAFVKKCCRFKDGMRLWVRENFQIHDADGTKRGISYNADPDDYPVTWLESGAYWQSAIEAMGIEAFGKWAPNGKTIPGIRMPRWASRLTLEVTTVRVDRLQAITDEDAAAEGVAHEWVGGNWPWISDIDTPWRCAGQADNSPKRLYAHLWDKINGAGSWEENPWVWVVSFKQAEKVK
jgi:hypothetical protein